MLKKIISILAVAVLFSPLSSVAQQKPEVMAVLFYADWCNSCKVLDPELQKARTELDLNNQSVMFVTLDLTDDTTKHQAQFMANELGISEFYSENAGSTGFLLLVDAETKETLTRITKTSDAEAITSTVHKAIDHASAS